MSRRSAGRTTPVEQMFANIAHRMDYWVAAAHHQSSSPPETRRPMRSSDGLERRRSGGAVWGPGDTRPPRHRSDAYSLSSRPSLPVHSRRQELPSAIYGVVTFDQAIITVASRCLVVRGVSYADTHAPVKRTPTNGLRRIIGFDRTSCCCRDRAARLMKSRCDARDRMEERPI